MHISALFQKGQINTLSFHLASSSITPAGSVHKSRGDSVVRMWVQLKRWCVSCVRLLQNGHSGDGCELASTLSKQDLRKGDSFVLSWARVRRVKRESTSSELLMRGGCMRINLSLPLVARCLETIDVCIWRMFVFMSVVVTMWEFVGLFVVQQPVLKIVFFQPWSVEVCCEFVQWM